MYRIEIARSLSTVNFSAESQKILLFRSHLLTALDRARTVNICKSQVAVAILPVSNRCQTTQLYQK